MLTTRLIQVSPRGSISTLGLVNATNVEKSTLTTSNTVTVTGLTGSVGIVITGGEYSVNGAAFTSSAGSIANGNTLAVRHTSSSSYTTSVSTSIQIGVNVSSWSSTTRAQRTTPAAFSFTAISNAALSTVQSSSSITVSGMDRCRRDRDDPGRQLLQEWRSLCQHGDHGRQWRRLRGPACQLRQLQYGGADRPDDQQSVRHLHVDDPHRGHHPERLLLHGDHGCGTQFDLPVQFHRGFRYGRGCRGSGLDHRGQLLEEWRGLHDSGGHGR